MFDEVLLQIQRDECRLIPEAAGEEFIEFFHGSTARKMEQGWLVPCKHTLFGPATDEQIDRVERTLSLRIPEDYRSFWKLSDGARLYETTLYPREIGANDGFQGDVCVLLGCRDLIGAYRSLLKGYREISDLDRESLRRLRLNYLAVIDLREDNYLEYRTDPAASTGLFKVDNELGGEPWSEEIADMYYVVGNSLEHYLSILLESHGSSLDEPLDPSIFGD